MPLFVNARLNLLVESFVDQKLCPTFLSFPFLSGGQPYDLVEVLSKRFCGGILDRIYCNSLKVFVAIDIFINTSYAHRSGFSSPSAQTRSGDDIFILYQSTEMDDITKTGKSLSYFIKQIVNIFLCSYAETNILFKYAITTGKVPDNTWLRVKAVFG